VTDSRGATAQIKVPITILGKNAGLTGPGKFEISGTDTSSGEVKGKITGVTGAEAGETIAFTATADRTKTTLTTSKGATVTVYSDGRFVYSPTLETRYRAATATDKSDTFTVFATDGYGAVLAVPVKVDIVPAIKDNAVIDSTAIPVAFFPENPNDVVNGMAYLDAPALGTGGSDVDRSRVVQIDINRGGEATTIYQPNCPDWCKTRTVAAADRAYVEVWTADTHYVSVVDTKTRQVIGNPINLPGRQSSINPELSPDGNTLVVAGSTTLSVIGLKDSPPKASTFDLGVAEILAVKPIGRQLAYVSVLPKGGGQIEMWLVDTSTGKRNQFVPSVTLPLPPGCNAGICLGNAAKEMVFDEQRNRLYVSTATGDLIVINTFNNKFVTRIPKVGSGAVAVTPDGKRVYVANPGAGSVSVINTDPDSGANRNTLITTVTGFTNPRSLTVSPDGKQVQVVNECPYGSKCGISVIGIAPSSQIEAKPPTPPAPPPNPPAGGGTPGGGDTTGGGGTPGGGDNFNAPK